MYIHCRHQYSQLTGSFHQTRDRNKLRRCSAVYTEPRREQTCSHIARQSRSSRVQILILSKRDGISDALNFPNKKHRNNRLIIRERIYIPIREASDARNVRELIREIRSERISRRMHAAANKGERQSRRECVYYTERERASHQRKRGNDDAAAAAAAHQSWGHYRAVARADQRRWSFEEENW